MCPARAIEAPMQIDTFQTAPMTFDTLAHRWEGETRQDDKARMIVPALLRDGTVFVKAIVV